MAFDLGGLFGGGLSGAASGSAFGPIGTIGGAILGGIGGGLSGGSVPQYQMTPLQEELSGYALRQVKASPGTKKAIKKQFKALRETGNRGAAEALLEQYRDRFSNPEFIEKKLAKSYARPIDFSSSPFQTAAQEVYGQQGLGYKTADYETFMQRAKGRNIRSPQAFADMLKQDLIASGKVMTPMQEQLSYFLGTPARTPEGYYTNEYRTFDYEMPELLPSMFNV